MTNVHGKSIYKAVDGKNNNNIKRLNLPRYRNEKKFFLDAYYRQINTHGGKNYKRNFCLTKKNTNGGRSNTTKLKLNNLRIKSVFIVENLRVFSGGIQEAVFGKFYCFSCV